MKSGHTLIRMELRGGGVQMTEDEKSLFEYKRQEVEERGKNENII